jgi:hypothetical protein
MEIAKPNISDARCAESVKIAIDLAKIPPAICKMTKTKETPVAIVSLRIATLFDSYSAAFLEAKLIGVFAGRGVPYASGGIALY